QQGNRVLDAGCLLVLDVRRNLQHGLPACIAPWHAPRVYERLDTRDVMTLTQLNAFVLVARLGSVTAAANALAVSEPAVSQALAGLRQRVGDRLAARGPKGMTLTTGGSRLLAPASQIVVLGAEAHAAVRAARGAPEQLRVVATSTIAELVVGPLMDAFTRRFAGSVEVSAGVAATSEM